ncbi:MAG: hypothetical protein JKX80_01465 [Candidatus Pacebacteria bacterium]|nr:hypothetical protein [Candidatus Paceibacterota bacterium]
MKKWLFTILFTAIAALLVGMVGGFFATNEASTNDTSKNSNGSVITIFNEGGTAGGHTPRGFSGMGSGLFAGDNLNPNFPEGDGVQTFITFDVSQITDSEKASAVLRANDIKINGTPFEDLGNLVVDAVSYDVFSRDLWDSSIVGSVCTLATKRTDAYECDVSSFIQQILADGEQKVQFRIRFESAGDSDGEQDMVFFYMRDSNSNEVGVFELEITTKIEKEKTVAIIESEELHIVVNVYVVKDSGEISTRRDVEEVRQLLVRSQEIWNAAGIVLDISIEEIELTPDVALAVAFGNFRELYSTFSTDNTAFNIFYVKGLLGPNGIALPPRLALVADITSVDDFRATAHEIGHLLGLVHTLESRSRLMFGGANGRDLSNEEINSTRAWASALQ